MIGTFSTAGFTREAWIEKRVAEGFTKEQAEFMAGLVKKQRIRGTLYYDGSVKSYRYVIVGMLLKNPLLADFGLN